jgi:uncharacterized protein
MPPANYLHGVETIEVQKGARPVRVVKSAVIALVGIAPEGPINTPTLVQSPQDAAQFGVQARGFSIPQALDQIFKQGNATVVVVNVFNPETMTTAVSGEEVTITNLKGKLAFAPVQQEGEALVSLANGETPLGSGTDYTIDKFGNIEILSNIDLEEGVQATYQKIDATEITAALLIGTVDGATNARTGLKCFDLTYTLFGFTPKIFIAPGYSTLNTLAAELIAVAENKRAIALIDAPIGTTPANAITGRGPAGSINFNTSSKRAYLMYPHLKALNVDTGEVDNFPYSSFMAGVIANTDNAEGYWVSPSNKEIKGIVGAERTITASINDASTEANLLNENGITTVFNAFGSGIRTWGNRSAAFPSNTAVDNFINVRRTADIIHESLELASLQFMDKPINDALIDAIAASGQGFINTLIGRGAVLPGSRVFYNPNLNSDVQIAAGNLIFSLVFIVPTPLERLTYESTLDISLFSNLGGQS